MKVLLGVPRLLDAVMFVAPDDEVQEGIKEVLRQVVGGSTLGMVLVHRHQVKPLIEGLLGPQHLDLVGRRGRDV